MIIHIKKLLNGPNTKNYKLNLPGIPQTGDYVSSDKQDFSGYVQSNRTIFHEDEDGNVIVEVSIK